MELNPVRGQMSLRERYGDNCTNWRVVPMLEIRDQVLPEQYPTGVPSLGPLEKLLH